MVVFVCPSKFSNLVRSCSIEMIQHAQGTAWHLDQDAFDDIMFGIVCFSKFSYSARSCSIEVIQLAPGTAWECQPNTICEVMFVFQLIPSCLVLFGFIILITQPDFMQSRSFNFHRALHDVRIKTQLIPSCLTLFDLLYLVTSPLVASCSLSHVTTACKFNHPNWAWSAEVTKFIYTSKAKHDVIKLSCSHVMQCFVQVESTQLGKNWPSYQIYIDKQIQTGCHQLNVVCNVMQCQMHVKPYHLSKI
jgi:hypothetical protein